MLRVKKLLILTCLLMSMYSLFAGGTSEAGSTKPAELDVWMINNPNADIIKAFDDAAINFEAEKGVKVNYIRIPTNDFHTKLITSASAGVYPDVIIWNSLPGIEFSSTGMVEPLNNLVNEIGREKFGEGALAMFTIDENLYEAPFLVRPAGLHVRKDWLVDAGYDPTLRQDSDGTYYIEDIRTWEDVLELGKKINNPSEGKYGLGFAYSRKAFGDSAGYAFSIISSYGGHMIDDDGNVTINSPETQEALSLMKRIWESGAVPSASTTWDGGSNNQFFIGGDIGIVFNSNSIMPKLNETTPVKPEQLLMVPFPSGPAGSYMSANPESISVFKTQNLENAKEFARYMLQEETQIAMFETMGFGYYSPLRKDVMANPLFNSLSQNERVLMSDATKAIGASFPGNPDARLTALYSSYLFDDALSRIAVDGWSVEKIAKEMEKKVAEGLE